MATLIEQARAIRDQAKAVPTVTLTLAQFAESRRIIAIYSEVLDEEVIFAADNARLLEPGTRTVYRARELALLSDWSPEGLRLAHEVKKKFGGQIEPEP